MPDFKRLLGAAAKALGDSSSSSSSSSSSPNQRNGSTTDWKNIVRTAADKLTGDGQNAQNAPRGSASGAGDPSAYRPTNDRWSGGASAGRTSGSQPTEADRIALGSGTTWALNTALRGTLGLGDRVLIGPDAHNSVLRPLHVLASERSVDVAEVATDDVLRWDLDDLVRQLREERGISLKDMAAALNVSSAYLSALEHGRRGKPTGFLLHRMIAFFNVIWDEAEELQRLSEISDPKITIDTGGLVPEATELTNRLAADISKLDADDLRALRDELVRRSGKGR